MVFKTVAIDSVRIGDDVIDTSVDLTSRQVVDFFGEVSIGVDSGMVHGIDLMLYVFC